jgi:hypothetical protein
MSLRRRIAAKTKGRLGSNLLIYHSFLKLHVMVYKIPIHRRRLSNRLKYIMAVWEPQESLQLHTS